MANVSTMAAGKFSDPVLLFVLVVANNSAHTHEIASFPVVEASPSLVKANVLVLHIEKPC